MAKDNVAEKNDFIQLEFTGKNKEGIVFDTNVKSEAEKIDLKIEDKEFIVCIGQKMVLEGLDKALEGKEIGKLYTVDLSAKEAFGERKKDLIKLIPKKAFIEKNINPIPGMTLNLDNYIVRIASVSGGRVLVDFNNPLAGKEVSYEFKIKEKITDDKKKISSLLNYFLRQEIPFEIKGKKATVQIENEMFEPAIKMINDKFKDILGLELIAEKKKEDKKSQ